MTQSKKAGTGRTVAAAGVLVALVAALAVSLAIASRPDAQVPTAAAGKAARSACGAADGPAADTAPPKLRRSVRCLVNRKRAKRGLRKLKHDRALRRAAQRHSKRMVKTGCLDHRCGNEPALEQRLVRAGYAEGAKRWAYAENTGCAASAAAMVETWLRSREHRLNLLGQRFRDIGVGVVNAPVKGKCRRDYATFTVVVAWREPTR